MDLGCIDMGCVEKPRKETSLDNYNNIPKETVTPASKSGKYSKAKDAVRSSLSAFKSQISKPPRRKTSPVNWFPRKKVEPYLKRKLKMLQEVDGMQLTLDETLGDSNPHYSKLLREKMAIQEAAEKAMEARKDAMVEASWCRILHTARIGSKEAETQLAETKRLAAEAFEAARAAGVIMNDEQNQYKIETSSATTHTVSATFETAFEVDKQVAGAVKAAFIKLANCPSLNKDEFKDLLRKISENPENEENLNAISSVFDSDIVDMMLSRIRCLKEEELASLATIVATSGLNAALAETGNNNESNNCPKVVVGTRRMSVSSRIAKNVELPSLDKFLVKRLTKLEREVLEAKNARKNESFDGNVKIKEEGTAVFPDSESVLLEEKNARKNESSADGDEKRLKEEGTAVIIPDLESGLVRNSSKLEQAQKAARMVGGRAKQNSAEIPSLDKFLVKRLTRLEREVLDAKNACKNESFNGVEKKLKEEGTAAAVFPDLESGLAKDSSKLEKSHKSIRAKQDAEEVSVPSLDKFLVKRLTRLEREVEEAKEGKNTEPEKENKNLNKIKNVNTGSECESLDKVLVKRVSRLEKEKLDFCGDEQMRSKPKRKDASRELESGEGSLDQVFVKQKSRLERERSADVVVKRNDEADMPRHSVSRRQAREKELQAAWGGLSLGNSMRPHVSKLQRDKADWIKAEEDERKRSVEEEV